MAREVKTPRDPWKTKTRYTVADGVAIDKGTYLKLSGDRTAAASTGTGDIFVGFANADKEASDGATSLTANKGAICELVASGAIGLGQYVKTAAPGNYVMAADDDDVKSSYAIIVGRANEAASDGETINVEVVR